MIRATRYLPSILKLQQHLLSKHCHRSSHEHLKERKIGDVISDADNGIDNHYLIPSMMRILLLSCADRSMQVKEMVECTRKAWNLVKGRLYTHGKLILTLRLIILF